MDKNAIKVVTGVRRSGKPILSIQALKGKNIESIQNVFGATSILSV